VFNGNRNQFRKRIDITISAFAEFAKDKPDAMLYLHMGTKDQGWDVMQLFGREMQTAWSRWQRSDHYDLEYGWPPVRTGGHAGDHLPDS
jgi:hypothetical protein